MMTRPRTSSIPSLHDAQYAIHAARRQPARRIAAYTILAAFLGVFLILGFGSGYTKYWEDLELGGLRGSSLHTHLLFPQFLG